MDDFQKEMFDVFVFETNSFLEQLEALLMEAESRDDSILEAVPEIFRIMHTIKSSSAMMGFENISKLAHRTEDLFYFIREKKPAQVDKQKLTDLVFRCVDFIRRNMNPESCSEDPASTIQEIGQYLDTLAQGNAPQPKEPPMPEPVAAPVQGGIPAPTAQADAPSPVVQAPDATPPAPVFQRRASDRVGCSLRILFKPNCAMIGLRAFELTTKVGRLQAGVVAQPTDDDPEGDEILASKGLLLTLPSSEQVEEIIKQLEASPFVGSVTRADEAPRRRASDVAAPSASDSAYTGPDRRSGDARNSLYMGIEIKKLDKLINLSGEIIIASMGAAHAFEQGDDEKTLIALEGLHRLILDVQDQTLSLRMVSLRDTFHKLNRSVRDATGKLQKKVDFVMAGEDTAVDRNVIDHLFSPLMHILRNAVDHGIELPQEREAAGKPAVGKISLSASIQGDQAVISVMDDGRGINRAIVMQIALDHGLITQEQAQKMSDEEVNALIFLPGFSTKSDVTELSGRGVGMDVVNESVRKLNGRIHVSSVEGQGTRIDLRIPLTLAILEALLVRADQEVFAIPSSVVREIFTPDVSTLRQANGQDVIIHRDACYPVVRMSDIFEMPHRSYEEGLMILINANGDQFALFIHEVLQQQSIVVKPTPALLKSIKGLYGCTILGSGQVCLIIDVVGLLESRVKR